MKNPFTSTKSARALREELDHLIASETDRKNRLANLEAEFDSAFATDDARRTTTAEVALSKAKQEDLIASQIGDRKRAALQARIDEAEAAEAVDALAKQVKTITEKRDAIAKSLKERIPAMASEMSVLAVKAKEIDAAIRSLPEGTPFLRSPFLEAFFRPEISEKLISSREVSRWVYSVTGSVLPAETTPDGASPDGKSWVGGHEIHRQRFVEETFIPAVSSNFPYATLEKLVELLSKFDLGPPAKSEPQTRVKPI